jgi:hypothetical protein
VDRRAAAAPGYYRDSSGHYQAFAITEKHGTWGAAKEMAAALNTGGNAAIESVSCASAGNCGAGGQYVDGSGHTQVCTAALNQGGNAVVQSLSCASANHCSASGSYAQGNSIQQAFVVNKS